MAASDDLYILLLAVEVFLVKFVDNTNGRLLYLRLACGSPIASGKLLWELNAELDGGWFDPADLLCYSCFLRFWKPSSYFYRAFEDKVKNKNKDKPVSLLSSCLVHAFVLRVWFSSSFILYLRCQHFLFWVWLDWKSAWSWHFSGFANGPFGM